MRGCGGSIVARSLHGFAVAYADVGAVPARVGNRCGISLHEV